VTGRATVADERASIATVPSFDITPEQASRGLIIPDTDLPMLAAQWLVAGCDLPGVRELVALSHYEGLEARRALAAVLAELGFPVRDSKFPYEELRGAATGVASGVRVDRMDHTHTPYASAQYVLEILGDVEDLWEPGGGKRLMSLLHEWDDNRERRPAINKQIRAHPMGLREDAVPPLRTTT
jgi:hypothetical protein